MRTPKRNGEINNDNSTPASAPHNNRSSLSRARNAYLCKRDMGLWFLCVLLIFQVLSITFLMNEFDVMADQPYFSGMLHSLTDHWTILSQNQSPRRRRRVRRQPYPGWDPGRDGLKEPANLTIGFPVFVASLSKSGTTSIWQYFNCGGHPAAHQWIKLENGTTDLAGLCMWRNIQNKAPPFQNCGTKQIFTDTSFARFIGNPKGEDEPLCYYPSIDALEQIYDAYPNGTLILVNRETKSWYNSMATWGEGTLLKRLGSCHLPNFPDDENPSPEAVMQWYEWHNNHIRTFARKRPWIRYIEVGLEGKDTGKLLEQQIGIPAMCWGKCTPLSKFCQKVGHNETHSLRR